MAIVVLDYAHWQRRYPELALWVSLPMYETLFELAQLYCDNTPGSKIKYDPDNNIYTRQTLLELMTSHLAALNAPLDGQPSPTLVGRINSAMEGSVSVGTEYPILPGQEWYAQSKYGAMFWAATQQYRRARYYPAPQPFYITPGASGGQY